MPHFFIPPENIHGQSFVLKGPEAHHLLNVRRCRVGQTIHLFDGTGKTYTGRIDRTTREEISGVILEKDEAPLSSCTVRLYQSVPKGDRFDWLVEKTAELGVAVIIPLITERSTIKDIPTAKIERWRRLALAACKQCNRADLIQVETPVRFADILKSGLPSGTGIIPWEGEDSQTMDEALSGIAADTVNVFIGPEGGFTLQEIERSRSAGLVPVTLGPRILRAETAGLVASLLVLHSAGEFGAKK